MNSCELIVNVLVDMCDLITSALVGVLIVLLVWHLVKNFGATRSKSDLNVATVSSFRLNWIKVMRGHLVDLIVLCKTINQGQDNRHGFERCRANILMLLNPMRDDDRQVRDMLDKITFDSIYADGDSIVKQIDRFGQMFLMEEWEYVKFKSEEIIKEREKNEKNMCIVAYLDMFGKHSRIENKQPMTNDEIRMLYENTKETAEKYYSIEDIKTEVVSDNIIVVKILPLDSSESLKSIDDVLMWCSLFQKNSISGEFGRLTRGMVRLGNFYTNAELRMARKLLVTNCFGKCFTKDPKIVIDAEIRNFKKYGKTDKHIIKDVEDNLYYLDYMNKLLLEGKSVVAGFEKIKSIYKPSRKGDEVDKMLRWHMKYVNNSLNRLEPNSGERLKLDEDFE